MADPASILLLRRPSHPGTRPVGDNVGCKAVRTCRKIGPIRALTRGVFGTDPQLEMVKIET